MKVSANGLTGEEGTFSMCTFWLVEALCRAGRVDEARLIFEQMLGYANHLGLYAEEIGPSGESLGNFPPGIHTSLADQRGHQSRSGAGGCRPRMTPAGEPVPTGLRP